MDMKDYYAILGVAEDAPKDEIRKAYRKLARKYHPDVSEEADAEARFKEIGEAWEVLGDDEKRAGYDQMRAYGAGPGDFQGFQGGEGIDPSVFSDLFETLFGRGAGGRGSGPRGGFAGFGGGPGADFGGFGAGDDPFAAFGAGGPGAARRGPAPSGDVRARLQIPLEEAYAGGERTVRVDGSSGGRTLKVKIPAGVTDGRTLRLRGQGRPGGPGRPAGDLLVEIALAPHGRYTVDGRDLTLEVPLTPSEAALGDRVTVDTLGGPVEVKVPAGTQTGSRLRLRGRGLPGDPAGDQYLVFRIAVPKRLSTRERELYEALAEASDFDPRA
jgi:curved DNA-binding protein